MYISSLLALKAFLNSVVADDLHVVTVEGGTLTISRNNALDVVLGTYELKEPVVPEVEKEAVLVPTPDPEPEASKRASRRGE